MAEERRSAAIAIVGKRDGESFDLSCMSQSLPCKPRSLARASPALEPPPLELPKTSPCDPFEDSEKGRTLIRYSAEISAAEFSCSPKERQQFLSQSCPNWGTFHLPQEAEACWKQESHEPKTAGAMDVPQERSSSFGKEDFSEAEVTIGKSPTILESFKMYTTGALGRCTVMCLMCGRFRC